MANLFPTYDLPSSELEDDTKGQYNPSVYFDFETGDFVRDGSNKLITAEGRDAYVQWCMKVIDTERDTCQAYSTNIGTELEGMVGKIDRKELEAEIISEVTDALMVHPCTEYVSDFLFEHGSDYCNVSFIVKGRDWEEVRLSTVVSG